MVIKQKSTDDFRFSEKQLMQLKLERMKDNEKRLFFLVGLLESRIRKLELQ